MEKISKTIWSPSARRDVAKLIEYLHSNWTKSVAKEYLNLIDRNITLIQQSPYQFPFINEIRDIHKCVIS